MKIIRNYSNVAEAGFAQSLLEAAGIAATLLDEHAATLGPQFVPWGIRLEVPDDDAQRALEILDHHVGLDSLPAAAAPDPSGFAPPISPNNIASILAEIRSLRRIGRIILAVCILLLATAIFYIAARSGSPPVSRPATQQTQSDSWQKVQTAVDRFEYDKATEMLQRIVAKYPKDYYGYAYLGNIALASGKRQDAEHYYARAYELLPTEENEKKLTAVRRLMMESGDPQPPTSTK